MARRDSLTEEQRIKFGINEDSSVSDDSQATEEARAGEGQGEKPRKKPKK